MSIDPGGSIASDPSLIEVRLKIANDVMSAVQQQLRPLVSIGSEDDGVFWYVRLMWSENLKLEATVGVPSLLIGFAFTSGIVTRFDDVKTWSINTAAWGFASDVARRDIVKHFADEIAAFIQPVLSRL